MSVYYRIRNARGRYATASIEATWSFQECCWATVFYSQALAESRLDDIQRWDPTARVVKVTVKRKVKWPVERARAYLKRRGWRDAETLDIGSSCDPCVWAQSKCRFRYALAVYCHMALKDIKAAVAEVLGGKL